MIDEPYVHRGPEESLLRENSRATVNFSDRVIEGTRAQFPLGSAPMTVGLLRESSFNFCSKTLWHSDLMKEFVCINVKVPVFRSEPHGTTCGSSGMPNESNA